MSRRSQSPLRDWYEWFATQPRWVVFAVAGAVYLAFGLTPAVFPVVADPQTGVPNYNHAMAVAFAPFAPFAGA